MGKSKYAELGVDVSKKGIEAFKDSTSGLYKHAFCDIHPDEDMHGYGFVHHTDGAGSKPVQNYLNWKVAGKIDSFRGIAQDTLAMNAGDALCVGIPESGSFVDYVAINGFHVPKREVLNIFAEEFADLFDMLDAYGINIRFAGGETADLPDQLKTLDVSGAIHARYKLDYVITGEDIRAKDVIIGIASDGQASYEHRPAGAIMSNGLTLARHCLMKKEFGEKYPEIREPGKEYTGPFSPTDKPRGLKTTVGEELTLPTRVFAPIFRDVRLKFDGLVHGIVFNTGGGHTKCLRVGKNIGYLKDHLPEPPPIFKLIQRYGEVDWREMYTDFNIGVGAEMYVDPRASRDISQHIQKEFGIKASRIGKCFKTRGPNKVRLETPVGNFNYKKE